MPRPFLGPSARARLADDCFDLSLMDVQMSALGGLEATRRIREREKATGERVPIVAMTAHAVNDLVALRG